MSTVREWITTAALVAIALGIWREQIADAWHRVPHDVIAPIVLVGALVFAAVRLLTRHKRDMRRDT